MQHQNNIIGTILLALGLFALPDGTQAISPPPDGGYPGGNTAEGQNALLSLTTGGYNTATGFLSLEVNTAGSFNTAIGAGALLANTAAENTATGVGALLSNTTGLDNTASGVFALFSNTEGHDNTADGDYALFDNTSGSNNTALGRVALYTNTTGSNNTAVGSFAGHDLTTGDNNIDIGFNVVGLPGESNTIRIGNTDITDTFIRGISGATASGGAAVFVNGNGKLGTVTSSARFKEEIKPMDKASEVILALKPVCFRYMKEIDPQGIPQFGLVAEEVERVNPDLVIRDAKGKPYTVRYEQVNAMLLNEFLKEHRKVEKLEDALETIIKRLNEQEARIHKVSAELQVSKPARNIALNSQ